MNDYVMFVFDESKNIVFNDPAGGAKDIQSGKIYSYIPKRDDLLKIKKFIDELLTHSEEEFRIHNEIVNEKFDEMLKYWNDQPSKPKVKNIIDGYFYILKPVDGENIYKIGIAQKPESRIKTYKTENYHEIKLILCYYVKDCRGIEEKIKKEFFNKNIRGEWFKLDISNLHHIFHLLSDQRIPEKSFVTNEFCDEEIFKNL